MIFFSLNLLKLFQYYPEKQSIFILFPPYFHLISIHSPFIVRSSFVICSSHFSVTTLLLLGRGLGRGYFVRLFFIYPFGSHRPLFVHCSSFVRSLFVLCSFIVRHLFVHSSFVSLFRYNTPSPWERVGERIFCSFFIHLLVRLAPSFVRPSFQ